MMEKSLQGAIQKMGGNFLVAAFVPAMAFVIISLIAFYPILLPDVQTNIAKNLAEWNLNQFIQLSFVVLIFVTILGFTLYALSTYIYKAFEGYSFILEKNSALRRSFIRRQKRRFKKIESERIFVEKQLEQIDRKIDRESEINPMNAWREKRLDRYIEKRKMLDDRKYALISDRNENFPPSIDLILPTRFGNILRAAELYPGTRYSIDAVPLWGRLAHVIPKEGMEKLDEANNQCLFLLNAAVLASVFSVLCLLTIACQGFMLWLKTSIFHQVDVGIYIVLAILALAIAWFFYEASLLNVSQYGSMIRTAYDLYRFKLLEALRLELPASLRAERILWRDVSNFMVGNNSYTPLDLLEERDKYAIYPLADLPYHHPERKTTRISPES